VQLYTAKHEDAVKTLELRMSLARKMNMKDGIAETYFYQAITELLKERVEPALSLMQNVIAFSEKNDISLNPIHYCVAGVLYTLSGDTTTGKDFLERVECLLELDISSDTGLLDGFAAALKETEYSSSADLVLGVVNKYNSAGISG
ncbi:MAG: hypothetical protein J7K88_01410, partial [Candidatus Fermentibacteraceae bacterium]|nr:hypothetical protein [Candidatus Fermentibacteraceae bacterium]